MTDIADNLGPTLPCQNCAAEVAIEVAVRNGFDCPNCGASLPERPDYAVERATTAVEVVRAYGSYGYIDVFTAGDGGTFVCPGCAAVLPEDEFSVDARRETDPGAGPSGVVRVLALRCPRCRTPGTIVLNEAGEEVRAQA